MRGETRVVNIESHLSIMGRTLLLSGAIRDRVSLTAPLRSRVLPSVSCLPHEQQNRSSSRAGWLQCAHASDVTIDGLSVTNLPLGTSGESAGPHPVRVTYVEGGR